MRLTSAVHADVLVAAGAGHTHGSPLVVVCLMGRVEAVLLEYGRVGVTTAGGATSVAVTCRTYLRCVAVVAMYVVARVLRAMIRRWRQRLGRVSWQ